MRVRTISALYRAASLSRYVKYGSAFVVEHQKQDPLLAEFRKSHLKI